MPSPSAYVAVVDATGNVIASFGGGGGLTNTELRAAAVPVSVGGTVAVSGVFYQATQPVSLASAPLPTGAATAAKQPAPGTAGTPSADVLSVQGVSGGTPQPVSQAAAATGGYTPGSYVAAASANQDSTVIKASAGTLGALTVMSVVAGLRYLKVYDKATAPTSADTPKLRIPIPASTTGAGVSLALPSQGLAFASGIAFRITTGIADADANAATAGDCAVNYGYA